MASTAGVEKAVRAAALRQAKASLRGRGASETGTSAKKVTTAHVNTVRHARSKTSLVRKRRARRTRLKV